MLASVLDLLWIMGAACSAALLLYGGYLVYVFQSNASVANQRAVARLALHESAERDAALLDMKESALIS